MRFHVTENGPRECRATVKACPLGGEHYSSLQAADEAYAQLQGGSFTPRKFLPATTVKAKVKPFAGGRYYGCHVGNDTVEPFLQAFRGQVGEEKAELMEVNKAQRDRGVVYHLTVVTPPEMKNFSKSSSLPETVTITYKGVGKAFDGQNEAWFIVCESPEINEWRKNNNLPPKELHITLGFDAKDVHTEPKGEDSIVIR